MHREAAALETLDVPGVPKLLDNNTAEWRGDTPLFVVMEFVDGPTLDAKIREGAMTLDAALVFARSIFETLRLCHASGVIHRDIKPDNVVLANGDVGNPKLVDFGQSFNLDEPTALTETSQQLGNRFLGLPELLASSGNKRDPRSDLTMAFGLFFFALTGAAPRVLRDEIDRAPHQRSGAREALEAVGLPSKALLRLFDQAFQVRIDSRFQSADACLQALSEVGSTIRGGVDDGPVMVRVMEEYDRAAEPARLRAQQLLLDRALNAVRDASAAVHRQHLAERDFVRNDSGGFRVREDLLRAEFEIGYTSILRRGLHVSAVLFAEINGSEIVVGTSGGTLGPELFWRDLMAAPDLRSLSDHARVFFERLATRIVSEALRPVPG